MKATIGTLLLLLLLNSSPSHEASPNAIFPLYQTNKSCVCIKTRKLTPTLKATEITAGGSIFQVFHTRSGRVREVFRVGIGTATGPMADKWWNYGISDEADFNGDGVPDYSWYGGDDSGFVMYLFLSSGDRYEQVDILKTVEAAWRERLHASVPDLGDAGGNYGITSLRLERSTSGLALMAVVEKLSAAHKSGRAYHFRIGETGFRK